MFFKNKQLGYSNSEMSWVEECMQTNVDMIWCSYHYGAQYATMFAHIWHLVACAHSKLLLRTKMSRSSASRAVSFQCLYLLYKSFVNVYISSGWLAQWSIGRSIDARGSGSKSSCSKHPKRLAAPLHSKGSSVICIYIYHR